MQREESSANASLPYCDEPVQLTHSPRVGTIFLRTDFRAPVGPVRPLSVPEAHTGIFSALPSHAPADARHVSLPFDLRATPASFSKRENKTLLRNKYLPLQPRCRYR